MVKSLLWMDLFLYLFLLWFAVVTSCHTLLSSEPFLFLCTKSHSKVVLLATSGIISCTLKQANRWHNPLLLKEEKFIIHFAYPYFRIVQITSTFLVVWRKTFVNIDFIRTRKLRVSEYVSVLLPIQDSLRTNYAHYEDRLSCYH